MQCLCTRQYYHIPTALTHQCISVITRDFSNTYRTSQYTRCSIDLRSKINQIKPINLTFLNVYIIMFTEIR